MENIKKYIEFQITKLTPKTPRNVRVYTINGIYAVLESRGYKREEIKNMIDLTILKGKTK